MGPLIVISGPSGSGKSTLVRRLLTSGWPLRLSVSVTTRTKRPKEGEDVDYHFWTADRVREEIARGGFLEWAEVFGNYYGTLRSEVEPYRDQGTGVVLDIDVNGWAQVKAKCPDAVSIFIRTVSIDVLEKRLRDRGTETEASMKRRLDGARAELARIDEYHYQVVNDDLETALGEVKTIVGPLFTK